VIYTIFRKPCWSYYLYNNCEGKSKRSRIWHSTSRHFITCQSWKCRQTYIYYFYFSSL